MVSTAMSSSNSIIDIQHYLPAPVEDFRNSVLNDLTSKGYALPSLLPAFGDLLDQARLKYVSLLSSNQLLFRETSFSFSWKDLSSAYISKFAIGSKNGLGQPYAQLLRTTYLPNSIKSIKELSCPLLQCSYILVRLRNILSDIDENFGYNPEKENFWNACRIHDYPCGGGFMMQHSDTAFPNVLAKSKIPFLQIYASLSVKGIDFTRGGGYVTPNDSDIIYTDRTQESRSRIALFDGTIEHGVNPIDPHIPFSFDHRNSRSALFASLYPVIN